MTKIKGLRKIAGETKCLGGYYCSYYLQMFVDVESGEAWTVAHCSLGQNSWTVYHDENIVSCGFICEPMTQKELMERINEKLEELEYDKFYRERILEIGNAY